MLFDLLKGLFRRSGATSASTPDPVVDNPLVYWFAERSGRRL